jgi:hypothetical protein
MTTKYTEWHETIPMVVKHSKMATKYTNMVFYKTLQNIPKMGTFGFENIPSGMCK